MSACVKSIKGLFEPSENSAQAHTELNARRGRRLALRKETKHAAQERRTAARARLGAEPDFAMIPTLLVLLRKPVEAAGRAHSSPGEH